VKKNIQIEIRQRIYVKKNNKRVIFNKRTHKPIVITSKAYMAHEEELLWEVKSRAKGMFFAGPVNVDYVLYISGMQKIDFDNLLGTINDILTDAGVIADDTNILMGTFKKVRNAKIWGADIKITELDESQLNYN
jgi:Holliday junction resolvase RusA-like endonuclease